MAKTQCPYCDSTRFAVLQSFSLGQLAVCQYGCQHCGRNWEQTLNQQGALLDTNTYTGECPDCGSKENDPQAIYEQTETMLTRRIEFECACGSDVVKIRRWKELTRLC